MTLTNNKNVYVLAYAKEKDIKMGEEFKTTEYMFWIDKKHDAFRKLHKLPDHIELNEKEKEMFLHFIGFYN